MQSPWDSGLWAKFCRRNYRLPTTVAKTHSIPIGEALQKKIQMFYSLSSIQLLICPFQEDNSNSMSWNYTWVKCLEVSGNTEKSRPCQRMVWHQLESRDLPVLLRNFTQIPAYRVVLIHFPYLSLTFAQLESSIILLFSTRCWIQTWALWSAECY